MDFYELGRAILYKRIFEGYWKNLDEAKKLIRKLLVYIRKYEKIPELDISVSEPEFPPEYQIAKTKSMGYSDKSIIEKAKEKWGFKENKVREIIENRISIQSDFNMKLFCEEWKEKQSTSKGVSSNLWAEMGKIIEV